MDNGFQEIPSTKERLLTAAREEFYQKGYRQASLRSICSLSGLTTGALYFFFSGKDDLFCSVVDPVINQWTALTEELAEKECHSPHLGPECDRIIMEFELKHKKELLILLEKSAGSSRESFREYVFDNLVRYFTDFFTLSLGRKPQPEVIKLLAGFRFQSNLDILKGDYDMEQALFFNDVLACYADSGFQAVVKNFKDVL